MPRPEGSIAHAGSIAEVLRDAASRRRTSHVAWAIAAAVGFHVAVVALAIATGGDRASTFVPAVRARPDRIVELFEPPAPAIPPPAPEAPPPPPSPPAVKPAVAKANPAPAPAPAAPPAETPAAKPPPAQAAAVVAAPAEEIVDFGSFDIATGSGKSFAGGVTSSSGTNTVAVRTRDVDPNAAPGAAAAAAPSRARSVRLSAREWDCPWPAGARALRIDEQSVVIRVVVRADGSVESGSLVEDPGDGFGEAALACARRTRFEPALDAAGEPVRTTSPPIRIRFTR